MGFKVQVGMCAENGQEDTLHELTILGHQLADQAL